MAKARDRPRCRISRSATIAVSRNQRRFNGCVLSHDVAEYLG